MPIRKITAEINGKVRTITADIPDGSTDDDIAAAVGELAAQGDKGLTGSKEWAADREKQNQENLKRYTQPEDKGVGQGLSDTISPSAILGAMGQAVRHPIDTVSNILKTHSDMESKAGESFQKGDYMDAATRGLASAVPVAGPAAYEAGQDIREGRTGYGIGKGLGLTIAALLPGAIKAVSKTGPAMTVRNLAAEGLRTSAEKQYGQVLNPTTRGLKKVTEDRIVPQLIERGETYRSLNSLKGNAAERVESLGAKIGDYWDNMPDDAKAPVNGIVERIKREAIEEHTLIDPQGNAMPLGPEARKALKATESLTSTLEQMAVVDESGMAMVNVKDLRKMRQYYDKVAANAKRYQGAKLSDANKAEVHGKVADAIREEFAKADPSLDAINKEFSFWKDVEKVAEETVTRRVGQAKPLTQQMGELAGAAVGAASGGVTEALVGAKSFSMLSRLTHSTAWRTMSAVTKDRLANALARGQKGTAQAYINQMAEEAESSPTQSTALARGQSKQQPGGARP